ncbi:MAG: hypothetical protein L0H79_04195 [Intrasporangium sp.]|uniref:hypothetical protein n=1 Tax=Intrasporangium sp. TaxID=1925024 RepID=UPI00264938B0|nr:hypothetical protein [Intrasporangium sp.]MDN5794932.1 hypothetical protein [Intrasporangium sp.]
MTKRILAGQRAARRRRLFTGRSSHLELFRGALADDLAPFAVLQVYGPGGVGKTALLDAYADLAEQTAVPVRRIPPNDGGVSREAFLAALGSVPGTGREVLLVDGYERLLPLDGWLRTEALPGVPDSWITVLAGRPEPSVEWRTDPVWQGLRRDVALRNLSPRESAEFLAACGLDPGLRSWAADVTHGHPLALALVADLLDQGAALTGGALPPDVVSALLSRLVEATPDAAHRRALEVSALSRVTTEPLLRDVLGADGAGEAFAWLRGLSCMEAEPDGLRPHDLARDVIDAELRWRDPETYAEVFRAVSGNARRRLAQSPAGDRQRAAHDFKYIYKNLSGVLTPVDWDTWGQHRPEPARPADGAQIVDIAAGVGPQTASAACTRRRRRTQRRCRAWSTRSPSRTCRGTSSRCPCPACGTTTSTMPGIRVPPVLTSCSTAHPSAASPTTSGGCRPATG